MTISEVIALLVARDRGSWATLVTGTEDPDVCIEGRWTDR